jgi:hypothetical protein
LKLKLSLLYWCARSVYEQLRALPVDAVVHVALASAPVVGPVKSVGFHASVIDPLAAWLPSYNRDGERVRLPSGEISHVPIVISPPARAARGRVGVDA